MARIKIAAMFIAASAFTTGCTQGNPELATKHNPTLYSIHQPVVQRTDYAMDLPTIGGSLSSPETDQLNAWFESLQLGYGDRIFVDMPDGYTNAAIRNDIAQIAAAYGLLLNEDTPITTGDVQPGTVRIIINRARAHVPGCPDWSYARYSGAPISTDSNYGCAVNSNLAAMVADPHDLVSGKSGTGISDAANATKAVKQYRDAVPTGAAGLKKSEKTTGDK